MKNVFMLELKQLNDHIAKIIIDGETAGYISLPENEHQNQLPFAISHNGKDIGYEHCNAFAIERIARHFTRTPQGESIRLVNKNDALEINIVVIH